VYTKPANAPPNALAGIKWTRHLLHNFGPLNKDHTGSIHQVVCADIDGDNIEEILVALMGSDPPSWERTGVWCFKRRKIYLTSSSRDMLPYRYITAIDLRRGKFERYKLSDNSAGRIAVNNFTNRALVRHFHLALLCLMCFVQGFFNDILFGTKIL
jgi:aldos-2-ulose dehydratase